MRIKMFDLMFVINSRKIVNSYKNGLIKCEKYRFSGANGDVWKTLPCSSYVCTIYYKIFSVYIFIFITMFFSTDERLKPIAFKA